MAKKYTITIVIIALVGWYLPFYGLTFPPCPRRELIPQQNDLKGQQFNYTSQAHTSLEPFKGCTQSTKGIKFELNGSLTTSGPKFPQNSLFTIEKTIYLRVFGFNGFESGGDWSKYFIVSDDINKYIVDCLDLALVTTLDKNTLNCDQKP